MFNPKIILLLSGLFFTHFAMAQWTPLPTNTNEDLYAIDFLDAMRGAAVGNNSTILLTTDGGSSWTAANTGEIKEDFRSVLMVSADTILAGAGTIFEGRLYRSINGGQDWEAIFAVPEIAAGGAGTVGFDDETVYYSPDHGDTWDTTDLEIGSTVLMEDLQFAHPDTGYLTGNVSGFTTYSFYGYRTVDGGAGWAPFWVFDLPNNNAHTSFAAPHPDTTFLFNNRFENYVPASENQLVRLTDFYFDDDQERNSWRFTAEIVNDNMPGLMISSLFLDGSRGFAGSAAGDLYETMDGGETWTTAYDGDTSIFEITLEESEVLYATGGNGLILKYSLSTDTHEPVPVGTVRVFPNPVRDLLNLRDLPGFSGRLSLHSLNGQFIRSVEWTPEMPVFVGDLPAGAYLLQVRSEGGIYQGRFIKQ
ncbi:YCF48-related protein [Flavilitoribacter nigricans]|uniref:Photosynthesis system II assembly factor Ycf48/Hcf136-like domain-containing protein n=1 Tax=Flavilitoribacter nigricans (strain ATCC 23147 / DSM 23189 / NBRC 102662 / NCIMB 1420 / SS-2) TaxID=1122177 RepID=A0A2D0N2J2_FLAN2|nr:YCF48-related protein [Flavilitoribacter nigricans]PHN02608.1 hypothetical protein CRP01_30915 [Flavilitoribacter nigricans DSM 23189 = NBRC 102662]